MKFTLTYITYIASEGIYLRCPLEIAYKYSIILDRLRLTPNPGSNPLRRDNNSIISNSVSHKGASLLWTRFEPDTIPPETSGRGKLECVSDQLIGPLMQPFIVSISVIMIGYFSLLNINVEVEDVAHGRFVLQPPSNILCFLIVLWVSNYAEDMRTLLIYMK
ncbi:hypothetical protein LXL04_023913 [Taraxacum kok-saghyz]